MKRRPRPKEIGGGIEGNKNRSYLTESQRAISERRVYRVIDTKESNQNVSSDQGPGSSVMDSSSSASSHGSRLESASMSVRSSKMRAAV